MFDLGWTELLFIAVVAIIVIGPKDLPRALRAVGHWTGKARRMAGDFQRQFNEAIREADLDDVKKQVTDIGRIDPIGKVREEIKKVETEFKNDLSGATEGKQQKPQDSKPVAATGPSPESTPKSVKPSEPEAVATTTAPDTAAKTAPDAVVEEAKT